MQTSDSLAVQGSSNDSGPMEKSGSELEARMAAQGLLFWMYMLESAQSHRNGVV